MRDRQAFTLEEAVRMLTLAPSRAWGFHDRGMVREGLVAEAACRDAFVVAGVSFTALLAWWMRQPRRQR